ncbi:hypothetical protein BY996DRAFT_4575779 [Phakopsora pachyrhizi]|uniref:Uncharacterized protein n=1 Tax=Phakopsora pachyrhizi TaxID=170000 RepID=A0AAV0BJK7_PHAPC|nr:hypothetical protein BY996DRAFT_4575779 [Phakopsora pachyrhizi]CAH7686622.1 hypothetical protein PPACK8108_LOCUS21299 [Phakopsora pachyrhizi]
MSLTSQSVLEEDFLLILLSDSNLPVGGFVSSSGLESFVNHSFMNRCKSESSKADQLIDFIRASTHSYGSICVPFFYHVSTVVRSHLVEGSVSQPTTSSLKKSKEEISKISIHRSISSIKKLNQIYDSMCLSQVNQRNSKAQGAAMLMLYVKSFVPPSETTDSIDQLKHKLFMALKDQIRRDKLSIHFPISFSFVTTLLCLSFDRSIYLHLFLHMRSILSSAVRLNIIGPYQSQRLLFDRAKSVLEVILDELRDKRLCRKDQVECELVVDESGSESIEDGPSTSWPFGEIVMSRHDVCHVRLFNS